MNKRTFEPGKYTRSSVHAVTAMHIFKVNVVQNAGAFGSSRRSQREAGVFGQLLEAGKGVIHHKGRGYF